MASSSYSNPKYMIQSSSSDPQSAQRLIQNITTNIQKIAQNGNIDNNYYEF